MSALKFDHGKPRMELLPPLALQQVALVLAFGAKKYGDFNWLNGFDYSRLVGACLRHIFAYVGGETNDPESGLPHLSHACCCLLFILELAARGIGKDDRGYTANVKVEEHKGD